MTQKDNSKKAQATSPKGKSIKNDITMRNPRPAPKKPKPKDK